MENIFCQKQGNIYIYTWIYENQVALRKGSKVHTIKTKDC